MVSLSVLSVLGCNILWLYRQSLKLNKDSPHIWPLSHNGMIYWCLVTLPSHLETTGTGSSPVMTLLRDKIVDDDRDIASVGQSTTIPSGVQKHRWWHELCSHSHAGSKPVRRIKASILSPLQKKPFGSIIHPCLVTVLISLPPVSPQTTSTPSLPCPLHI